VGGAAISFTAERLLHWIRCLCIQGIANLKQANGDTVFVVLTSERETWDTETEIALRADPSRFVASSSLTKEVRDSMAFRISIADDQSLLIRSLAARSGFWRGLGRHFTATTNAHLSSNATEKILHSEPVNERGE